jgi:hypothetical protein
MGVKGRRGRDAASSGARVSTRSSRPRNTDLEDTKDGGGLALIDRWPRGHAQIPASIRLRPTAAVRPRTLLGGGCPRPPAQEPPEGCAPARRTADIPVGSGGCVRSSPIPFSLRTPRPSADSPRSRRLRCRGHRLPRGPRIGFRRRQVPLVTAVVGGPCRQSGGHTWAAPYADVAHRSAS